MIDKMILAYTTISIGVSLLHKCSSCMNDFLIMYVCLYIVRTFSTLLFTHHSDNDAIENGAKCYNESGKSVGKFVTRHGDLGLAILKLSDM